jgi:hypothetical protein
MLLPKLTLCTRVPLLCIIIIIIIIIVIIIIIIMLPTLSVRVRVILYDLLGRALFGYLFVKR